MLKIDGKEHTISIAGESTELLSEMTALINTLYRRFAEAYGDKELTDMVFKHCFHLALVDDEVLTKEVDDETWERIMGEDDEL